jgi:TP901-1 family phage major tail protein
MAAQKGSLFILKIGDGATPDEAFTTIGGMRTNRFTLNNQAVDTTNRDSGQWRALLEGAGNSSLSISASGIFEDSTAEETLRGYAFANSIRNFQFTFGNGDSMTGAFQISSYSRGASYNDAETFSISLQSAGAVTFVVV